MDIDFRSDEAKQEEVEQRRKIEDMNYLRDLNEILKLSAGKRFFKKFIREGRVFNANFIGNASVHYKEGKRALVLEYLKDLNRANPKVLTEIFLDLLDEENEDDRKRN